jgi:hypothetical protein
MRSRVRTVVVGLAIMLACNGEDPPTSSTESAITGDEEEPATEDGVITEPVPPDDFTGDPNATLPISAAEEAALAEALALSNARNPVAGDPLDSGFATLRPAEDTAVETGSGE